MPLWEAHCQPVIQASYQKQSERTHLERDRRGFHNIWCFQRKIRGGISERKKKKKNVWQQSWFSGMEILDQHQVLPSLWIQVSARAGCCQCSPAAEWRLPRTYSSDALEHCTPFTFRRYFCFFDLHVVSSHLILKHFLSSLQPRAAIRGHHNGKTGRSPSFGSSWTSGSCGGQTSWAGPSFANANLQHYLSQQHPHHQHQSAHTSYAYCLAHTAVSTAHCHLSSAVQKHFFAFFTFLLLHNNSYAQSKFILPLISNFPFSLSFLESFSYTSKALTIYI